MFVFFPILALGDPPASKTLLCPPVSALTKDPFKQTWSSKDGFKSFDISFVTSIKDFLGAQWSGATVGQITCVYSGLPKQAFNVLLYYGGVAQEPSTQSWGKNLGGYRNCISRTRKTSECPFDVQIKSEKQNIYEEIEKYKS